MFLNYNRSVAKYVALWICTLGIYNILFKREVVHDFNVACGEKRAVQPGAKYFFLNIITLGIYGIFWDLKFLALCQEFITESGSETKIDLDTYRFVGIFPVARIAVLSVFIKPINEVCKIYSDKQLEETEADDDFLAVNRVREVDVNALDDMYVPTKTEEDAEPIEIVPKKELPDNDDIHKVAGYAVIEEYDPDKDQKRIAYRLQMEREARARAREAAKNPVVEEVKVVKVEEKPLECRRRTGWFIKVFAAVMAIFLLPLITVAVTIFALPPVYDDSFVGVLGDKYDMLANNDDPKIVVVGGSSVAFGLDSWLIEEAFGGEYDVVNFGLYADLGTKLMMDLSKVNINEGDIIVLAPEMNAQTLSLFFNGDTTMQALDGNPEMLLRIDPENYGSLIGSSLRFASDKLGYIISGEKPDTGRPAYQKKNFNDNGDNTFDRPYNEMTSVQNVITLDFNARLSDSNVTDYEEYIEYVNKYVHYAERRGATVYFSFCPMNEAAMSSENDEDSISDFYENLCKVLECKVISNVYDYILEEGYFYDSEFHLNNAGVTVRTVRLIDDLKRAMEIDTKTDIYEFNTLEPLEKLPAAPGFKPIEGDGDKVPDTPEEELADAENAKNFVYEEIKMGNAIYYAVVGLSYEGKTKDTLTIPDKYNGCPVTRIDPEAFKDSTVLKKLYLGNNINAIQPNALSGSSITEIFIPEHFEIDTISVPNEAPFFTDGCAAGLMIYVPTGQLSIYTADYFWSVYMAYLTERS